MAILLFGFNQCAKAQTRMGIPAPQNDASLTPEIGERDRDIRGGPFFLGEHNPSLKESKASLRRPLGTLAAPHLNRDIRTGYDRDHRPCRVGQSCLTTPLKITYGKLLQIFFSVVHDPTQLNRQGPDVGTSYRSAIFFTNEEQQRNVSTSYIAQLNSAGIFLQTNLIVTEETPFERLLRCGVLPSGLRPLRRRQSLHPGLRIGQRSTR